MRISDWSSDVCSSDLADPSAAQRRMKGPAMSVLQVRNVNKSFAGLRALNDVNLMIEDGSVHDIIGPNGAGKSTLLNCFTARLNPHTGTVEFNGTSPPGLSPHRITPFDVPRLFHTPAVLANR